MKFRKNLIMFLESIDIFSRPIAFLFTFQKKSKYSNVSTKFMTILVIILSIGSFFYFAQNYILKTNPQIIPTEMFDVSPGQVPFGPHSLAFSFGLESPTANFSSFIDESIYKVEAFLEIRTNGLTHLIPIGVEKCDLKHIPSDNQKIRSGFEKNSFTDMYCFQDYSKVMLINTWDSDYFQDIKIMMRACNNLTDQNICKDERVINSYIEGGYVGMYYTSFQTYTDNYKNPLQMYAMDNFLPTSRVHASNLFLFFGKIKVVDDSNTYEGFDYIDSKSNSYLNSDIDESFLNIYIRLDGYTRIITRKYEGVLDVLSKIGGLIRVLTFLGNFIIRSFVRDSLFQSVSNDTFDYEDMKKETNSLSATNSPQNHQNTKIIKLSLWEYVLSKYRKKNLLPKKTRILLESIKTMKQKLDVSFLMNKFFDIEKIILVLNNKELEELKNKKPKIILSPSSITNANYKSENEVKFHRNFAIISNSIIENNHFSKAIKNIKRSLFRENILNENSQQMVVLSPDQLKNEMEFSQINMKNIEEESNLKEINSSRNPDLFKIKNFQTQ